MEKEKVAVHGGVKDFHALIAKSTAFGNVVARVWQGKSKWKRKDLQLMMRHAFANAELDTSLMFSQMDWDTAEVRTVVDVWRSMDIKEN